MLTFSTEKIDGRITRIFAFSTELMYLIEGTKLNVLIDTGSGFGSLKRAVDAVLNEHGNQSPLAVLLTHGHVDHACGAGEFAACGIPVYMSFADRDIYERHSRRDSRLLGLEAERFEGRGSYNEDEDFIPSADAASFRDIKDGEKFDLGDVAITAFACPGHTPGSRVFLISEEGGKSYLLTGDACNTFTFLFMDEATSIEEYEETLAALAERLKGRYDAVFLSHGDGEGYVGILEDACAVCERIKRGDVDALPFSFMGTEGKIALDPEKNAKKGNIIFNPNRIWKGRA